VFPSRPLQVAAKLQNQRGVRWIRRRLRLKLESEIAILNLESQIIVDLSANLQLIRARIQDACNRAGRAEDTVTLLAVSKGQPPDVVKAGSDAGLLLFGENKIQEAKAKIPLCPGRLRWHMIGHLQSNKCRDAVGLFEMIQSIDSASLAAEVNKWAEKAAKTMPVLLEVNVAGESSKFGLSPDALLDALPEVNRFPRIEIHGLMTIAPWSREPETARSIFRRLGELKVRCEDLLSAPLPHLSMGMSGDFEVAIEEGATIIRLGTSLFGPRPKTARLGDGP